MATGAESPPLVVGQRIRVLATSADGLARRAMILAFDGDALLEIEYEKANGEEAVVPRGRCVPLLPAEELPADAVQQDAEERKLLGNALFKFHHRFFAPNLAGPRAPLCGSILLLKLLKHQKHKHKSHSPKCWQFSP